MKRLRSIGTYFLACAVGVLGLTLPARTQTATGAAGGAQASAPRDGQHDFDFNLGKWHTHIRRLVHPLTGSTNWVEMNGTVVVKKVWTAARRLKRWRRAGMRGVSRE